MSDGSCSKVLGFYRGSTVLITGASGFLGRVLLEKILRSLEVSKVYVVIRPKWNCGVEARLQRILDGQLFDTLRSDSDKWQEIVRKIVPVEINLDEDEPAIVEELKCKLVDEVNVVFNLLATVSFNEPLDCALRTNVEYTDRILGLVSEMPKIAAVVHVSTFYSNCDKQIIEEHIYDDVRFGGVDNVINIASKLNESEQELLTEHMIGSFPNTYTFSKKCAEVLIQEKYRSLPIGIFRPPIVSSTYREPVPGWIDNFNGPSGLVVPLSTGLYSGVLLDTRMRPFIVPVDYCVNALITCAADVRLQRSQSSDVPVYNYTDDSCNLSWREIIDGMFQGLTPINRFMAKYITSTITRNRLRYVLCTKIMWLQAFLLDMGQKIRGEVPVMGQVLSRMVTLGAVLQFFCLNEWQMSNDNVKRMRKECSEQESLTFPFDLSEVDWDSYYRHFVPGVIKYAVEPRRAKHLAMKNLEVEMDGVKSIGFLHTMWTILVKSATVTVSEVRRLILLVWEKTFI